MDLPSILDNQKKRQFLSDGLCQHENYLNTSLQNQYSANFGGIVMDLENTYKYEASVQMWLVR